MHDGFSIGDIAASIDRNFDKQNKVEPHKRQTTLVIESKQIQPDRFEPDAWSSPLSKDSSNMMQ